MHSLPQDFLSTLGLALDREAWMLEWWDYPHSFDEVIINLGAGKKFIDGTHPIDYPDWKAGEPLPFSDSSVDHIVAYHFFEHLTKDEVVATLREVERVLKPSRFMIVVSPHWSSEAAHQDLDHKSFWSESTWKNLFNNPYYEGTMPREWKLRERITVIAGLVQRNLMIVSQIEKIFVA